MYINTYISQKSSQHSARALEVWIIIKKNQKTTKQKPHSCQNSRKLVQRSGRPVGVRINRDVGLRGFLSCGGLWCCACALCCCVCALWSFCGALWGCAVACAAISDMQRLATSCPVLLLALCKCVQVVMCIER